jgi:hypothetical protein
MFTHLYQGAQVRSLLMGPESSLSEEEAAVLQEMDSNEQEERGIAVIKRSVLETVLADSFPLDEDEESSLEVLSLREQMRARVSKLRSFLDHEVKKAEVEDMLPKIEVMVTEMAALQVEMQAFVTMDAAELAAREAAQVHAVRDSVNIQ